MLFDLHEEVVNSHESNGIFGPRIDAVLVSTPHLVALYEEDILEAIDYEPILAPLSMYPINGRKNFYQPRQSIAGMAGNGWGLYSNYTDPEACKQEESEMPVRRVYTIEYTNTWLHAGLQTIEVPRLEYGPYSEDETLTSFDFNRHAKLTTPDQESYWKEFGAFLSYLPRMTKDEGPITDVQFMSDCRDN